MLDVPGRLRLRGQCRIELSRTRLAVWRTVASRHADKSLPVAVERTIADPRAVAPDALAAQIADALEEAGAKGLPVHVTLGDELVRYFIVTPPGNSARRQDLRAAAAVRFQVLYGEAASGWQLVADWQAETPFLACAVSQTVCVALQQAVAAQKACLVSVTPDFVAAWNHSRRALSANAWLATLGESALTLGLVADATRPRLAAVRTLALPKTTPPIAWLREQMARAALLDDLAAPSVLHIHGAPLDAWQDSATATDVAGLTLHWCAPGHALHAAYGSKKSLAARFASRGVAA